MAHLDAHPTSDQEVVGSTSAGPTIFFHKDLIMKYFLRPVSPFLCFKKDSVISFWRKNVHNPEDPLSGLSHQ